jgi:hypothetical protein
MDHHSSWDTTLLWVRDLDNDFGFGYGLCRCGGAAYVDMDCYAGLNCMGRCEACEQRVSDEYDARGSFLRNEARFFVCMTIYPHRHGYGPHDVPADKPRGCFTQVTYTEAKAYLESKGLDINTVVGPDDAPDAYQFKFFLTPLLLITGMETYERSMEVLDSFDWTGYFEDPSLENKQERLRPIISPLPDPVTYLVDADGRVGYSMEGYTAYSAVCPMCKTEHIGYVSSD